MTRREAGWEKLAELAELGILTASLLHELRQPLFGVKGRLQLAREAGRPLDAEAIDELLGLLRHVDELLDHYAGLGRSDDSWTDFDLRDIVSQAASMATGRIRQTDVHLEIDLSDEPVIVSGRAVAMRQVALNLVYNALEAVAGGATREVRVALEVSGRTATLAVTDSGPGIPEALRAHVFEPFVTSKPAGTGLGLYITRTLVAEAGGQLEVDAAPGGGTTLTVRLPCAAPRAVAARR